MDNSKQLMDLAVETCEETANLLEGFAMTANLTAAQREFFAAIIGKCREASKVASA